MAQNASDTSQDFTLICLSPLEKSKLQFLENVYLFTDKSLGYDVILRKEKSSIRGSNQQGIATADFEITGIGYVDAYGPNKNTSIKNIAIQIQKKVKQSGIVYLYADLSEYEVQEIVNKIWKSDRNTPKNIIIIFQSSKTGKIKTFKRS